MKILKKIKLTAWAILFLFFTGCQDVVDDYVGKKPDDVKTINITMIAKTSTNPVFLSAFAGAETAARALTEKYSSIHVHIDWRTPKVEDAKGQTLRIRNAVNDGTDVILVSCSDDSLLTSAINAAVDAGVPVMTFDSDAPNSKRFAFYGPNDVQVGENVMDELVKQIGNEGEVAILAGSKNAPNIQKRVEGIERAAMKYPNIKIVGKFYHEETATAATKVVLKINQQYPELKGWAMAGGWPLFSDALMDKIDPQKIKIVAVDALPVQLPYIEQGKVSLLFAQPTFKLGKISVEKIIDKIHLQEEVPEINTMKLIPVWEENLGGWARQLRAWGYEEIPLRYITM